MTVKWGPPPFDGRRTGAAFGNGTAASYGYDGASRLNCLRHDLGGSGAPSQCGAGSPTAAGADEVWSFAYTPASEIAARSGANPDRPYDYIPAFSGEDAYTHDRLNRTLTAAGNTLAHDGRGNITDDSVNAYTYDADNRLVTASGPGGTVTLTYDPAGRLYETSVAGGAVTRVRRE